MYNHFVDIPDFGLVCCCFFDFLFTLFVLYNATRAGENGCYTHTNSNENKQTSEQRQLLTLLLSLLLLFLPSFLFLDFFLISCSLMLADCCVVFYVGFLFIIMYGLENIFVCSVLLQPISQCAVFHLIFSHAFVSITFSYVFAVRQLFFTGFFVLFSFSFEFFVPFHIRWLILLIFALVNVMQFRMGKVAEKESKHRLRKKPNRIIYFKHILFFLFPLFRVLNKLNLKKKKVKIRLKRTVFIQKELILKETVSFDNNKYCLSKLNNF